MDVSKHDGGRDVVVGSRSDFLHRSLVEPPTYGAVEMWSLLLDFLSSIFVEWRLWKWIHDPPLKGDRPRQGPKHENDRQHPLVRAVIGLFLLIWIVLFGGLLVMLGQGIYQVVTARIG